MITAIPVLYYHSVGNHDQDRPWSFLTTPIAVFDAQIQWLVQTGYYFADLEELHSYVKGASKLPEKSVVLTFDDGFLDNYVFAYPIAKKYGARFTVFINPDFVDKRPIIRYTLDDVLEGRLSPHELEWWGYLSWDELRLLQKSGVVDVQSHALTHTWYPSGPRVVDFHHPGDSYYWLYWNLCPARKPYWLTEYRDELVPLGKPVYQHAEALIVQQYYPAEHLTQIMHNYVIENGGNEFFRRPKWREELKALYDKVAISEHGHLESFEEQACRQRQELSESKRLIEEQVSKPIRFLAWPGGATSERLFELAREVGYLASTKGTAINAPGADPARIMRGSACLGMHIPVYLQIWFLKAQLDRLSGRRASAVTFIRNVRRIAHMVRSR